MSNYIGAIRDRFFSASDAGLEGEDTKGFNTFFGVYLPSVLSIFGVIMYLRLGTVVGSMGLIGTACIIILSSMITFITGLSISATATNSHVGAGGAYYMISRAFGIEIGSAIGLALFLAQAFGLSFYIEGFSESVVYLFPSFDPFLIEGVTLVALTALTLISANAALRTQLLILFLIIASLASVFAGAPENIPEIDPVDMALKLGFWGAFALFFPAVTGIEAGFSMSGDLKSPKKSLPLGTLAAVVTGVVVYLVLSWFLWKNVPQQNLQNDSMILLHFSRFQSLIILGIWGATLSSAIGALLGAPRTLQALAVDRIVPKFLGHGYGEAREPRNATALTFIIASASLFFGNINIIAPILSMFFLISYGMLNLATAIEGFLENPSWRPTFSTPWYISLTGAFLCLFAMLMIDSGSTLIALAVIVLIYFVTKRKQLSSEWEDLQQGALLFFARFAIYRLANQSASVRSWRPNFLVFSRSPTRKTKMLDFASEITNNKGFLTIAALLTSEHADYEKAQHYECLIRDYLRKCKVQALVEVTKTDDIIDGMQKTITSYGLGPIAPNTLVVGYSPKGENMSMIVELIHHAVNLDKNVIIFKDVTEEPNGKHKPTNKSHTLDIWWDTEYRRNNELMMVLAYMLGSTRKWRNYDFAIKCVTPNENAREMRIDYFTDFFSKSRLDVDTKVYVVPNEQISSFDTISMFCSNSTFLFLGIRPPAKEENKEQYTEYLKALFKSVKSIPRIAFVLNSTDICLDQLFKG